MLFIVFKCNYFVFFIVSYYDVFIYIFCYDISVKGMFDIMKYYNCLQYNIFIVVLFYLFVLINESIVIQLRRVDERLDFDVYMKVMDFII